jgi:hypothetical protein
MIGKLVQRQNNEQSFSKTQALAKRYYEQKDLEAQEELKEVEGEIDKVVAELYGISDDELEEVRKTLGVLKGEDVVR